MRSAASASPGHAMLCPCEMSPLPGPGWSRGQTHFLDGIHVAGAGRDLDLSQNAIRAVGGLRGLAALRCLALDRNRLTALSGATGGGLACARALQSLSVSDNCLTSLVGELPDWAWQHAAATRCILPAVLLALPLSHACHP